MEKEKEAIQLRVYGEYLGSKPWYTETKTMKWSKWFWIRIMPDRTFDVLDLLRTSTSQDEESNPWETHVQLSTVAGHLEIHPANVSPHYKLLRIMEVVCPICDEVLRPGYTLEQVKEWSRPKLQQKEQGCGLIDAIDTGRGYITDLSPVRDILEHLQRHYDQDLDEYKARKQEWSKMRPIRGENLSNHGDF